MTDLINNIQTMSSLEIAKLTGKEHRNVMRDIKKILKEAEIDILIFENVSKNSQNQSVATYNLPKRECDLVISGYSVKYRLAIIDRWQELENKLKDNSNAKVSFDMARAKSKMEYLPMTDAVKLAHVEPKFYHYATEADLINRIVLGITSAKYRKENNVVKNDNIRDFLSVCQIKAIEELQRINTSLIVMEWDFKKRKLELTKVFNRKHENNMIEELHLLTA